MKRPESRKKPGPFGVLMVEATPHGLAAALHLARLGRRVLVIDERADLLPPQPAPAPSDQAFLADLLNRAAYHPLIDILTETEIESVTEGDGWLNAVLKRKSVPIRPDLCVDCGACISVCPAELPTGDKPIFHIGSPQSAAIDKRKKAPCRMACPLEMNPQAYIALAARGRFEEAYREIARTNPLPGVCGRICTRPCETSCRRGEVDAPLAIGALKRFVVEKAWENSWPDGKEIPAQADGPQVAIIGSGPAGLTAAHDLARAGFRPTLIEGDARPGGLLRQAIAPYRLPPAVLDREIKAILDLGVELRLNCPVASWPDVEDLKAKGFEAVVLASGASRDLMLKVPGETLSGVMGCVSFLKGVGRGDRPGHVGAVAVIGGGNAALEAARTAVRLGAESVNLLYRRTQREMPADPHEITLAEEEGAIFSFLTQPVAFEGENGALRRIRCIKMVLEDPDGTGRPRPTPVDGSDFYIDADLAVVSIGQEADPAYASTGLNRTPRGTIYIGHDGLCAPDVFAAGDVVSGPSSVVGAMASGRRAARAVMARLRPDRWTAPGPAMEDPHPRLHGDGDAGEYEPIPEGLPRMEQTPRPRLGVPGRISGFDEVVGPYGVAQALAEAARCLQCGGCCECFSCEDACRLSAIDHHRLMVRESVLVESVFRSKDLVLPALEDGIRSAAVLAGGSAALDLLALTPRASWETPIVRKLSHRPIKVGLFLCSCHETLNMDIMRSAADRFQDIVGVARVEVICSACHPEEGRRIEEAIEQDELSGVVIASCACCHLDFACESCTSQRIRLKDRLFRREMYDPSDVVLVNIKEAALVPFRDDFSQGLERTVKIVAAGLEQLSDRTEWADPQREAFWGTTIILGATPAGLAAAGGLMNALRPVVLVDDRAPDGATRYQCVQLGVELVQPAKLVRIEGRKGAFSLITEIESKGMDETKGYINGIMTGGSIILARETFLDLTYLRDPFAERQKIQTKTALGMLETSIPGIYLASWPVTGPAPKDMPAKAAATMALEGVYPRIQPYGRRAAVIDETLCRGCGRCAQICPESAVRMGETHLGAALATTVPVLCNACGACLAECPTGAVRLPGADLYQYKKVFDVILGSA